MRGRIARRATLRRSPEGVRQPIRSGRFAMAELCRTGRSLSSSPLNDVRRDRIRAVPPGDITSIGRAAPMERCTSGFSQMGCKAAAYSREQDSMQTSSQPLVGVVMGSKSDWPTLEAATTVLREFDIPFEARVVSAHRTPDRMAEYARTAESRGLAVIIAGAGGAAHLPGMIAAQTLLPVLGVPVRSSALSGLDSLLSIVQMPGGVPVGTLAIGEAGARNAGLLAAQILAISRPELRDKLRQFRDRQTAAVLAEADL